MASEERRRTLVFGYGSNGIKQLRARVKNVDLTSRGAILKGYARVFPIWSNGWKGGVASVLPSPSADTHVRGSVVELSIEELARLDSFEGGYHKETVQVSVFGQGLVSSKMMNSGGTVAEAIIYVANVQDGGQSIFHSPSEAYRTAIHVHLRQHWPSTIELNIQDSGGRAMEPKWRHPGAVNLSMEAFCVEINARLASPWTMPAAIGRVVQDLALKRIFTPADLANALTETETAATTTASAAANPIAEAAICQAMRQALHAHTANGIPSPQTATEMNR